MSSYSRHNLQQRATSSSETDVESHPNGTSSSISSFLRSLVPLPIRRFKRKFIYDRWTKKCEGASVETTFEAIYQHNLWGGSTGDFYSGQGSDANAAAPYCDLVRTFIRTRGIKSVVDIGCGDFRVGKNLQEPGTSYLGIDVVPSLIERNTREFAGTDVRFQVANAIEQPPPAADLCLIRQVLQHLSNQQILNILDNCRAFRYILVSDHLILNGSSHINVDKPHGAGIRPSGIRLDLPPFSRHMETLLEVRVAPDEVIRTVLIAQGPAFAG
jgi:SAM-dependent methyltransferase